MTDWSQECLCETPQNFDCKRQFKEETCELSAFSFFYVICMLKWKQMQKKKKKRKLSSFSPQKQERDLILTMQAQHLCSCHCRRLFCFESRFTGEAGAQRWVGEEWLMSGWRRESEVNTIAIQSGHWGTRVHPHMHSHVHTHTHTYTSSCSHSACVWGQI